MSETDPTKEADADGFLQVLVALINGGDHELPITLLIGGSLVSGNLISHERYFRKLADLLVDENMRGNETAQKFHERVAAIGDSAQQADDSVPSYIHLNEASFIAGGSAPIPTNSPSDVLWRGRICQVDGYHIGRFTRSA